MTWTGVLEGLMSRRSRPSDSTAQRDLERGEIPAFLLVTPERNRPDVQCDIAGANELLKGLT